MASETKATVATIEQALLERIQQTINNDAPNTTTVWVDNYHKFRGAQNFITAVEHERIHRTNEEKENLNG